MDYIKDVFLGQIHVDNGNKTIIELKHKFVKFFLMLTIILLFVRRLLLKRFKFFILNLGNSLNSASLSLDSWKAITDSDVLRELNVQRPLLQV
jgi:hypothetical protein